ncbi:hypothetical protein F4777DRAFT_575617 [Nemania sp. FL0916]|nr:hypothetical protein F4777DRAFT_575617 [Nemania sp. FL0916]
MRLTDTLSFALLAAPTVLGQLTASLVFANVGFDGESEPVDVNHCYNFNTKELYFIPGSIIPGRIVARCTLFSNKDCDKAGRKISFEGNRADLTEVWRRADVDGTTPFPAALSCDLIGT